MRVQLRDCTAKTWPHQHTLSYPNGTPKGVRGDTYSVTWNINRHHKYRLRVWGTGSYSRQAGGMYGGVGRFYASAPGKKHWKDWGGTGCR